MQQESSQQPFAWLVNDLINDFKEFPMVVEANGQTLLGKSLGFDTYRLVAIWQLFAGSGTEPQQ